MEVLAYKFKPLMQSFPASFYTLIIRNKNAVFSAVFVWFISGLQEISAQSEITVQADPAIEKMMEKFISKGKAEENTKAWRIQIITTDDRRAMEHARSTFLKMYPDIDMEWKHVAPYYQVRVGYFEKKQLLMPLLIELKKTFPAATPVYDFVSKRSVVNK